MMQPALHPTPRPRDVLREHLRALWIPLRIPAAVAAVLAVPVSLLAIPEIPGPDGDIVFHPERLLLPALLALVLAIVVWRGYDPFGAGFLWTVPVDRRRHALARVFAGWVWLMAAVTLFVLWLLAMTLLAGGGLLRSETIRVLASGDSPLLPGALRTVRLAPQPLFWLVPFTAATAAYLFASALALGVRHPLRWIVGTALFLNLVAVTGDAANVEWLARLPSRVVSTLYDTPYGIDALLTARTQSATWWLTLPTGERFITWKSLPDPGQWAAATLLWTALGLALLWAAASRHRELRRA